jgi:hypothetical protein
VSKLKLYKEGYIDEEEFQGEMAAAELALKQLDTPEVDGVTYGQGNTSRAWPPCGMWRLLKNATR